jgi:hypothetical protein
MMRARQQSRQVIRPAQTSCAHVLSRIFDSSTEPGSLRSTRAPFGRLLREQTRYYSAVMKVAFGGFSNAPAGVTHRVFRQS